MVVFLANSSGQPANRVVLSLPNWTILPSHSFKYYIINLGGGWGVKALDDLDDAGNGVQKLGKPVDVIVEHSHFYVMIYGVRFKVRQKI